MCERCDAILEESRGHGPLYGLLMDTLRDSDADVKEHLQEKGDTETRELWEVLSAASVKTLETLSEPLVEEFRKGYEQHQGLWKAVVEDYYVREAMDRVPAMVDRVQRLRPLMVERVPNEEVQDYLGEASRCFIHGFHQATVALSRSVLEAGLNEHLQRKLLHVPDVDLSEKINKAARFNLLSSASAVQAKRVRAAANRVLHDQPASEQEAFDVLVSVRRVLLELYGQQPR